MYERVSFGAGPIDSDLLNKLAANQDYLYEHMVTGYYNLLGVTRETGISFRVGHVKLINQDYVLQGHNVYFNRPFLPGTRPAVFLTLNADQHGLMDFFVKNLDGRAVPDHRGFHIIVHRNSPGQYAGEQYLNYLAIAPTG